MTNTQQDIVEAVAAARLRAIQEMADTPIGIDQDGCCFSAAMLLTNELEIPDTVAAAILAKMAQTYDTEMAVEWERLFQPFEPVRPESPKPVWRQRIGVLWHVAILCLIVAGALYTATLILHVVTR